MSTFRGVDHIGLTVADLDEAHRFLVDGLGATLLYQLLEPGSPPLGGPEVEQLIAAPAGAVIDAVRMYTLGDGPAIELFHYCVDNQRPAPRGSDIGFQHLAIYVDDLQEAVTRLVQAGGAPTSSPWPMMGAESGEGNAFCFVKAPFGALIELVTCPSPQHYEAASGSRRWRPGVAR